MVESLAVGWCHSRRATMRSTLFPPCSRASRASRHRQRRAVRPVVGPLRRGEPRRPPEIKAQQRVFGSHRVIHRVSVREPHVRQPGTVEGVNADTGKTGWPPRRRQLSARPHSRCRSSGHHRCCRVGLTKQSPWPLEPQNSQWFSSALCS
jgi:hypothetical protein